MSSFMVNVKNNFFNVMWNITNHVWPSSLLSCIKDSAGFCNYFMQHVLKSQYKHSRKKNREKNKT